MQSPLLGLFLSQNGVFKFARTMLVVFLCTLLGQHPLETVVGVCRK